MSTSETVTLGDAINSLYEIAVVERRTTSTIRLRGLANYCVQQLALRGLPDTETEVTLPGGGRPKQWDVAWTLHQKPRLAISLKSILQNLAGTVPNRIDDLMGEVANLQMYSPEIAIGYVMVFDVSKDRARKVGPGTWCDFLRDRLTELSSRRAPSWSVGMIEAFAIVQVDFSVGPIIVTEESEIHRMFDRLTQEVQRRNPSL